MTFLQEVSDRVDKEEEESVVLLHLERGAHQVQYCPVYPAHGEGSPPGTVLSSVSCTWRGGYTRYSIVQSSVSCTWRGGHARYSIFQCILHLERGAHHVQYCPVYPASRSAGFTRYSIARCILPSTQLCSPGTELSSVSCQPVCWAYQVQYCPVYSASWSAGFTRYSIVQCILPLVSWVY